MFTTMYEFVLVRIAVNSPCITGVHINSVQIMKKYH